MDEELECAAIDAIVAEHEFWHEVERPSVRRQPAVTSYQTRTGVTTLPLVGDHSTLVPATGLTPADAVAALARAPLDVSQSCLVCTAKLNHQRVAKRKCTCSSAITIQRHHCDRGKKRLQIMVAADRAEHRMLAAAGIAVMPEYAWNDAGNAWNALKSAFYKALESDSMSVDLSQLLRSQPFQHHRYAVLIDHLIHNDCELATLPTDTVRCLLDCGARVTGLSCFTQAYTDTDEVGQEHCAGEVPIAVEPLYIAACRGDVDMINLLLEYGADPAQPASDGTTPFFVACQNGQMPAVRLLHGLGVNVTAADQDGTAPIHTAAASGHLEVIKFLHTCGVDLRAPGNILLDPDGLGPTEWVTATWQGIHRQKTTSYWDYDWSKMRRNVTALTIARECEHQEIVAFLEATFAEPEEPTHGSKREHGRSSVPMSERAAEVGVAHLLKPIPPDLLAATTQPGSRDEREAAKRAIHKLQQTNQQIVARAEKKRLKQATLV